MSAPQPSSGGRGDDHVRAAERAADAARASQARAVRRRDRLVAVGGAVLDELIAPPSQRPRTRTAVCEFYGVGGAAVAQILRGHAAEFRRDGWRPGAGEAAEQWTEQAVVRAGLLLAHSEMAAELRHRLGIDTAPLRYSASDQRVEQCRRHYAQALALVEDCRQVDPDDVWRSLLSSDHHDLMALVVTLATLVPTDQPELGQWVKDMSSTDPPKRSVARGLALLIPTRPRRLRALPAGAPLRSVAGGRRP